MQPTRTSDPSTERFADQFSERVTETSPEFSPALHGAVMREVRREILTGRRRSLPHPAPRPWRIAVGTTAAVAALVFLALRTPRSGHTVGPLPVAVNTMPALPRLAEPITTVADPLARRLGKMRRDLLVEQVARLQRYCADQLQVVPSHSTKTRADDGRQPTPTA